MGYFMGINSNRRKSTADFRVLNHTPARFMACHVTTTEVEREGGPQVYEGGNVLKFIMHMH